MINSIDPRGSGTHIKAKDFNFPWNFNRLMKPNFDEFTWYNQQSCSYNSLSSRSQIIVPDIGSSDKVHILGKPLPVSNTSSYTVTLYGTIHPTPWKIFGGTALYLFVGDTTVWRGIYIFQNASSLMKDANPYSIATWTGGTASSSVTSVGGFSDVSFICLRMYSNITNRFWQVSTDGYNWKNIFTEGGNNAVTATHYGVGVYNSNNNGVPAADLKIDIFHLDCVAGNVGNTS